MRAPTHGDSDLERTASEDSDASTTPAAGRPKRGTVLAGKYRLEMLLGEGGMASVWSAYHLELELPVAIKLLRSGASSARLVERLRLEARAGAHLVHPSTVRIFDIATTDEGEPFIVMELLTGHSLAHLLARGRLSGVRAVQLMLPIAEALALAHACGIVHRDLKPDNVFLSHEGDQVQPKLLDFGIAKATGGVDKLTTRGTVLGSPYYMSPEQVRGEDVDDRSDIWSFCVVLYKAVVGTAPFRGPDKRVVMDAIASDAPARVPQGLGIDEELSRLLCWGLAKDPTRRPTSIRELGRHLAQWLISQGVSDDASGAPIAAKWLSRMAQPGLRHPPPYAGTREPRASERGRALVRSVPPDSITERMAVRTLEQLAPRRRRQHRRWALLAAAALSIVSVSVARTDSRQTSTAAASVPTAAAPPLPAPAALQPPRAAARVLGEIATTERAGFEATEREPALPAVVDDSAPAAVSSAEADEPGLPKARVQRRARPKPAASAIPRLPF